MQLWSMLKKKMILKPLCYLLLKIVQDMHFFFLLSAISDQQIFFNFIKSPILQFDMTDKHCATDWNACWKKKKKKKNFFWAT